MLQYPTQFLDFTKNLSLSLTSLRKAVLYALWQAEKPLKAYDILESLSAKELTVTATTIYRVLGFFITAGVLHKIDSIQAYALCTEPKEETCFDILMVCAACRDVSQVQDSALREAAMTLSHQKAFLLGHNPIELRGVCDNCARRD